MGLVRLGKVLIKYGKTGPLKYLSHLELIRALERLFRRAGIEVLRSGGFNPRPKMSHGPALSVGTASCAEYMLADIKEPIQEEQLVQKISSGLPEGLTVYGAKYIKDGQPSIASAVQSAAYRVKARACLSRAEVDAAIKRLISQERLFVRHKDKEKWVETREAILDLKVEGEDDGTYDFNLLLSLGDQNSIRPEIAIEKLAEVAQSPCAFEIFEMCRIEQYVNRVRPLINIYNFYESVTMGSDKNS